MINTQIAFNHNKVILTQVLAKFFKRLTKQGNFQSSGFVIQFDSGHAATTSITHLNIANEAGYPGRARIIVFGIYRFRLHKDIDFINPVGRDLINILLKTINWMSCQIQAQCLFFCLQALLISPDWRAL